MNRYELHEDLKQKAYAAGLAEGLARRAREPSGDGGKPLIVAGFERASSHDGYVLTAILRVGGAQWATKEMISRDAALTLVHSARGYAEYMQALKDRAVKRLLEAFADDIAYKTLDDAP